MHAKSHGENLNRVFADSQSIFLHMFIHQKGENNKLTMKKLAHTLTKWSKLSSR